MSAFYQKVIDSFIQNINNKYYDNYDEDRFGPGSKNRKLVLKEKLRRLLLKDRISVFELKHYLPVFLVHLEQYSKQLEFVYDALADDKSKELLVDLVSFRLLGNKKVKLKINSSENDKLLKAIRKIEDINDSIDPEFLHFKLNRFDLKPFGKNVQIYFTAKGILSDFFMEQYRYKNDHIDISAKKNDIVIDAGGCWGDTAIYFADLVGEKGKVYSFEFIPNNLSIFKRNCDLNPQLNRQIQVVDRPLGKISGKKVYFKDHGPGSKVEFESFKEAEGSTETIAIDDFVSVNNIERIDFIKMDIEGSELSALEGASWVIKKYRPRLAISIYHSWDDFVNIPKWILDLGIGYKIYLGHYTIHAEETVIFATPT